MTLERGALWRLGQLLVLRERHVSSEFNQDGLHREIPLPLCQTRELGRIDLVLSVDAS